MQLKVQCTVVKDVLTGADTTDFKIHLIEVWFFYHMSPSPVSDPTCESVFCSQLLKDVFVDLEDV